MILVTLLAGLNKKNHHVVFFKEACGQTKNKNRNHKVMDIKSEHFYAHLSTRSGEKSTAKTIAVNNGADSAGHAHACAVRCNLREPINLPQGTTWVVGLDWIALPTQILAINPDNNLIYMTKAGVKEGEGEDTFHCRISPGVYDPHGLAKAINRAMRAVKPENFTFYLRFDRKAKRFVLISDNDVQLHVLSPKLGSMLGMTKFVFPLTPGKGGEGRANRRKSTFPTLPRNQVPHVVQVKTSIITDLQAQGNNNLAVLASFPWASDLVHSQWQPNLSEPIQFLPVTTQCIRSIDLELTDQDEELLYFFENNDDITLSLHFKRVK